MNTANKGAVNSSRKPSPLSTNISTAPALEPEALSLPFSTGDIIAEKYKVVGLLGAGGVAYVVCAVHVELGEMVALKFLRPESLCHDEIVARFASEARAVARIKSEHVAHVLDVGFIPEAGPFIVMEYLDGKNLAEVLHEHGKLPMKVAVDYVLQACEALACAHVAGIVHRDIKPENLFLTQSAGSVEVVKVLDFGISKSALTAAEPGGRRYAQTMLPMGTPGYMSPEQIRACGTVDARTDIWSLGCVLSELLTGAAVFDAPTLLQLSATILERDPIPLRKRLPEAPIELEAIITKCLEKDAEKRFQDVAELALTLYPFGPRRSRISAERCHYLLKGQHGTAIELSSVYPPTVSGTMPVSSLGKTPTSIPLSARVPDPIDTSVQFPTAVQSETARQNWRLILVGAALVVLLGIFFSVVATRHPPLASVTPEKTRSGTASTETLPLPVAVPTLGHTPTGNSARERAAIGVEELPSVTAEAAHSDRKPSTASQRSKPRRAQRITPPATTPKASPKVKAYPTPDESEPDVGY